MSQPAFETTSPQTDALHCAAAGISVENYRATKYCFVHLKIQNIERVK
jgi:hypothetical protein